MSLITRCPACDTLFKVVPDQLRISEGWVRCGQCNEIFDASLSLLPPASAVLPQSIGIDLDHDSASLDQADDSPPAPAQVLPEAVLADEEDARPEVLVRQFTETVPPPPPTTQSLVPLDPSDLEDLEPERPAESGKVSFIRDQPTQTSRRNPLVHALLLTLGLVLALALGGQVLLHERDRIAVLQPSLRPWLLALCRPLNCTLSPVQHKDSVVIDGASFTKIRPDAYRLNFTLKNTESFALAVPAIELTLTDSLDQPVIRRVLLAPELGVNAETLAAASEWSASLAMAVKTAGTAERIVGYRLLAFYP